MTQAEPARRRAMALLVAGTALLPFQTWPAMPLSGMQAADILFALAFAQFLLAGPARPAAPVALAIAAFAAGAVASALAGGGAVKLLGHLMLAALGWMAATGDRSEARALRRALVAAAGVAGLMAAVTVVAYLAGLIGYDAAGRPDSILLYHHGVLEAGDYPRPRGLMVTGALMTSLVATGLCLLAHEPELVRERWLRRAVFALGAVALFFAFSRTIASVVVVLLTLELWRRPAPGWARLAGVAAGLVYAALLWVSLRYQVVLDPTRPWAVDLLAADGDRFRFWRAALAAALERPWLGHGPGARVALGYSAHNTWLNLWAVLGPLPLLAFAGLLLAAFCRSLRTARLGLVAALGVMLVESLYNDIEDLRHVWLAIGLALSRAPR